MPKIFWVALGLALAVGFVLLIMPSEPVLPTPESPLSDSLPADASNSASEPERPDALPLRDNVQAAGEDVIEAAEEASQHSLTYRILDEEVYDAPIKAQVVLQVLVDGAVTEANLRALLNDLYELAMSRRGFQYHSKPTNVYVYLFTSEEYAASGYQWVAMLDKSFDDPAPRVTVDSTRLELYLNPPQPESRFGLTEDQRRELFKDIARVGDRAMIDAEKRYPYLSPLAPGYSREAALRRIEEQLAEQDRLTEIYKNSLAEEWGLTLEELREVAAEGMQRQWPMPEFDG